MSTATESSVERDYNKKLGMGEDESEIQKFFEGRSVFITGASGYVGEVLLEQLLRLCPGIVEIFILIRAKSGCTPEMRKDKILNKQIFWKVKEKTPEALNKVYLVIGDLTLDGLGISSVDLEKLKANVSVVFHCAASVSFRQKFRHMVMNNVVGTYNVVALCRNLPKLVAFVHTSTAYANCYQKVIDEEIVRMPVPVKRIVEAAIAGEEEFLNFVENVHGKKWPNTYALSKSIAETVVDEADLPRAIVRPSLVGPVWKGSLPGYLETGSTLSNLFYGVALGFVQVMLCDDTIVLDTTLVDIVANTLIASAFAVATKRSDSPLVMNCIGSNKQPLRFRDLFRYVEEDYFQYLSPYTFRTPSLRFVRNQTFFKILSFLYHHVPGYAVDFYLRLKGYKPRCITGYKFFDQSVIDAQCFFIKDIAFKCENFEGLRSVLNQKDNEIFYTDISDDFSIKEIALKYSSANKIFQFKNDDVILKCKQVEFATKGTLYTQLYKCFLLFLLVLCAWYFVKLLFSILM